MRIILGAALAMLAAGQAQAQCGSCAPPPYPPQAYPQQPYALPAPDLPYDDRVFDGARVEAHVSYDRLLARLDGSGLYRPSGRDGLGYGGEVGYDVQTGGLVVGAYAGVDGSTLRECGPVAGIGTLCIRPGRSIVAGGRIGVVLGRHALLYAKGGYTNGQLRASFVNPLAPATSFVLRENRDGFHVGGGLEAAFSPRTYGRLEYVYTRLRDFGADLPDADGTDFDRHQVQGGVGLRF